MKQNSNYNLLISKLDKFTRKYYTNRLIKGTLYSVGLVLALFLAINITEHYLFESQIYNSPSLRKGLFYGFLGTSGLAIFVWVLVPLLQIFKLGRIISHEQAAQIIGKHFSNVEDKLLNVLQLKNQADTLDTDTSLIEASIDQKIDDIKLVPFTNAVDLTKNREYLKYALIPLLFFLGIWVFNKALIANSTERLINNDKEYIPDAPFHFSVENADDLEVIQYEDLKINVKVDGNVLPNEANIHINNFPYKLKKESPTEFSYKFNKVAKETSFYLEADGVRSKTYTVKMIPKPAMLSFDASLKYPSYVGKKNEVLRNSGDMIIPAGTSVSWGFEAQHTDKVEIKFGKNGKRTEIKRKSDELFTTKKRFYKDATYTVFLSNDRIKDADSISYAISVIPDLYPTISAEEKRDTNDAKYLYFYGDASDDYGVKDVVFKYKIETENRTTNSYQEIPIEKNVGKMATSFTHTWDLNHLGLKAGDRLTYFFEVWDNDAVNGSKNARSQMMSYELPSIEQLDEMVEQNNEEMKEDLEAMLEDTKDLKEDIKELKEDLVQKKDLNWEDKEKIEQMIQQHNEMEKQVEELKEKFEENKAQQEEYKEFSEETQEKQEKLQELMEEVMSDEMKELMEKLEKLLEEMNKEDIMEELEEFEMNDEQLEQELDRMLELFKELEMEQKMEETISKLEELAEEQEELSEETEQKQEGENMAEQEQKQEEIDEKFDDLKEDMKELDEMAKELNKKNDMQEQTKEQQEQISQDMQQSMEQMDQGKAQDASKKQKDAAQKMQDMAQQMQMMQMQMQQEQMEEDMQAIRQLLENLITLSKDQEDLMDDISTMDVNTPKYTELVQIQHKLQDDSELVEDSLIALSKRVFQLEAFITKELREVKTNMIDALDFLGDRKKDNANTNQQFIMTSLNNLALMLDEVQQQMQQQMAQQMQGNQMCNKPGNKPGGKPGSMGKMQKDLNGQIQKMQQGMKPGGKPMSKEVAQMAARQAAIRQALEKMAQENGEGGQGEKGDQGDLQKLIEEMEQTETDLINKQITAETLKRQRNILDKLLKAEKAQQERELDKKRLAQTAKQKQRQIPPEMEEYLKKRQSETELYKTVPPSLKPYYRNLVEQYFKSISF